jgi:hypothetical protein
VGYWFLSAGMRVLGTRRPTQEVHIYLAEGSGHKSLRVPTRLCQAKPSTWGMREFYSLV